MKRALESVVRRAVPSLLVLGSVLVGGCGGETGTLLVHWQRTDASGALVACGDGDIVHVNLGDNDRSVPCDHGGAGRDEQGRAYVGGLEIDGITAGGPYNLFLEVISGRTGHITAQTVVPAVGYIRSEQPLDAGVVVLSDPVQSGPESGPPQDLDAAGGG
ncbi:hypothetical protein AKJ09_03641 [Labilithrix luteola]|uniref:Lipoprotein n=1 Tax=Labilithrix luteola TaxID=1391654 RepID=A0A0K1PTY2_9BACT|nr:hypothetical protein [Labilithrix luteola]AKU96977.1 hypothetical protein AKJ09_03641 [Labilithrix luteola]